MNEDLARAILGGWVEYNGLLQVRNPSCPYIRWEEGDETASLDGYFTADDLEAIAWLMRKK